MVFGAQGVWGLGFRKGLRRSSWDRCEALRTLQILGTLLRSRKPQLGSLKSSCSIHLQPEQISSLSGKKVLDVGAERSVILRLTLS